MAKAKKVVDEMFLAASIALADHVDQQRIEAGTVYPPLEELREVSAVVSTSACYSALSIHKILEILRSAAQVVLLQAV